MKKIKDFCLKVFSRIKKGVVWFLKNWDFLFWTIILSPFWITGLILIVGYYLIDSKINFAGRCPTCNGKLLYGQKVGLLLVGSKSELINFPLKIFCRETKGKYQIIICGECAKGKIAGVLIRSQEIKRHSKQTNLYFDFL